MLYQVLYPHESYSCIWQVGPGGYCHMTTTWIVTWRLHDVWNYTITGQRYCISGNFHVIKGSREKNSRSKIFVVWAFHENLTRGENVEEYGRGWCIRGCHVYHEILEQLPEQLHYDGRRTCRFRPEQSRLYYKKFRVWNFRGYWQPRKIFNSKNFPIYGISNSYRMITW